MNNPKPNLETKIEKLRAEMYSAAGNKKGKLVTKRCYHISKRLDQLIVELTRAQN